MTNIKKTTIAILLTIVSLITIFTSPLTASASTVQAYSSALDDLSRDSNFNAEDYPDKPTDYSLQVIQIGEGAGGELFIYVYQPSHNTKDLKAKFINMSLQNHLAKEPEYKLYSLTWLNSNGVFDKYLVNDFTVSNDLKRYYNIATIYRPYDSSLGDAKAEALDDTNTYMGYEVGYCYGTQYYNDTLIYESVKVQVVDVEIVEVGSIRFTEGFHLYVDKSCEAHFMAFKVNNFDVTDVYDATVTYTTYDNGYTDGKENEKNYQKHEKKITCKDVGQNNPTGLFGYQYSWDRIQTIDEFKTMITNTKDEDIFFDKDALGSAQFVFMFLETQYLYTGGYLEDHIYYPLNIISTRVTDEGILSLHFATEKGAYNLGVVGDLVSDDGNPDFDVDITDNIQNMIDDLKKENDIVWQKFFALILLVIFILVISNVFLPIVIPIIEIIIKAFGIVLGMLLEIITYPLRLIFYPRRK